MSKPPSFGGSQDDDSQSTTEARLASSGSGDGSSDADKGLWSPEGCCTVNVTTTFVPNKVMAVGERAAILRENGRLISGCCWTLFVVPFIGRRLFLTALPRL